MVEQIFISMKQSVIINIMVYTGCFTTCPTTYDLWKLGDVKKISKLHTIIA